MFGLLAWIVVLSVVRFSSAKPKDSVSLRWDRVLMTVALVAIVARIWTICMVRNVGGSIWF